MAVFVGRDGEDAPAGALYSKVSIYGAVFLSLSIVLLTGLHVHDVQAYGYLTAEDSWVENGTAFLFFLTALLLLGAAAGRRPAWPYILGALAFVFAAGEEISWGQRTHQSPHFKYQMTPNIPRYTRCSISIRPNASINGRRRYSGQFAICSLKFRDSFLQEAIDNLLNNIGKGPCTC